ncbi:MAG: GGDEF domain-containing protein [Acidovorax sp.]|uniref:GGDEF domain-containing protein n=1 Tax=Acidovorax sp. TaxID=1872122 RepID=UPI00391A4ECD
MAVATSTTLWWTLRQTQELAQPYQQSDLWYVSSIHSELARVSLLAHNVADHGTSASELRERLDVLLSTLDTSAQAPRISTQLRDALPHTARNLDELLHQAEAWSQRLGAAGADGAAVAADIVGGSDAQLDTVRKAVAAVHLLNTQQTDRARQQLHDRFKVLSAVLGSLLAGTALLVWRLVRDARLASAMSQQLAQANRQLEVRVASRTRKIEEGRALLSFILDTSPSDVVLADVENGKVHFINHQLTERLGLKAPPQTLFLHQLLHDPAVGESLMQALDQYGQVDALEAQIGEHHPSWRSLSARLIEVDGRLAHLLWGFDISRHKELESQLRELATRDALTGLLNRRAFMEGGTALFDHCRRHAQPCTVLMIDIDHFKRINDQHGHQTGDAALRACAQAIESALRDADLLGRLGGEEFAALLPHSSTSSAFKITERIRDALARMHLASPDGQPLSLTVSIGMAEMEPTHPGIEPLLADADRALYRAKATGRNKVLACEPAIQQP